MPPEPSPARLPEQPGSAPVAMLPGWAALVGEGISRFKQNSRAIIPLGFLQVGAMVLYAVAQHLIIGPSVIPTSFGSLGIALLTALVWLVVLVCLSLAMLYAVIGVDTTVGAALSHALRSFWSYVWLGLAIAFVYAGYVVIALFLLIVILGGITAALGLATGAFGLISAGSSVIFALAFATVLLMIAPWFSFAAWAFIEGKGKGLQAVAVGRQLARYKRAAMLWRFYMIGAVWGIPIFLVYFVGAFFTNPTFMVLGGNFIITLIVQAVVGTLSYVFLAPLCSVSFYSLYQEQMARNPIETPQKTGLLKWLLGIGVLGILIVPIGSAILLASLNTVRTKGNDISAETNLSSLSIMLEIYADANDRYPASLDDLMTSSASVPVTKENITDPKTGQEYEYTSTGATYSLCATLSSGEKDCKTGSYAPIATSTPPVSSGASTSGTAKH